MRFLPFFVLALCLSACASDPLTGSLSPQAAERAARQDIAAGRPRIYIAGTRASTEVGVEADDRALVARLPRDSSLPVGCTSPSAADAVGFARAYNREIIHYLRSHPTASGV